MKMKRSKRKFTKAFKVKVAVEALKERETLSELASGFDLHPNEISHWKGEFPRRCRGKGIQNRN